MRLGSEGQLSVLGTGSVADVAARHPQVGLKHTVAKEAARRGIRVNTLHPGPIDNAFRLEIEDGIGKLAGGVDGTKLLDDMIPLHRHARPNEIACSALYLASDIASFVTAATLMAEAACGGEAQWNAHQFTVYAAAMAEARWQRQLSIQAFRRLCNDSSSN